MPKKLAPKKIPPNQPRLSPEEQEEFKYSEMSSEELMQLMMEGGFPEEDRKKIMRDLRGALRREEDAIKEEEKKKKSEEAGQRRKLAETKEAYKAARVDYLTAYRDVNNTFSSKSPVGHFDDLERQVAIFGYQSDGFLESIDNYVQEIAKLKGVEVRCFSPEEIEGWLSYEEEEPEEGKSGWMEEEGEEEEETPDA